MMTNPSAIRGGTCLSRRVGGRAGRAWEAGGPQQGDTGLKGSPYHRGFWKEKGRLGEKLEPER